MTELTLDMEELKQRWMKLYINIMILKSNEKEAKDLLEIWKQAAAVFNQATMEAIDALLGEEAER